MSAEQTHDLVCIGSGVSGCAAALAGVALGHDVCLVEKSARLGGATTYSYGGLWVGENHYQKAADIEDSREEARTYLEFLAGGAAIQANLDTYIDRGPEVLRAFCDMGLRFQFITGVPDHYYPDAPGSKLLGRMLEAEPILRSALGPWSNMIEHSDYLPPGVSWSDAVAWRGFGNLKHWDHEVLADRAERGLLAAGQALVGQFLAPLAQGGATVRTGCAARDLVIEDGRVTGVRCTTDEGEIVLNARLGVVIATGGYEGDDELVRRFEGIDDWMTMFPPGVAGDGLRMATAIGAALYRVPVNLALFLGYRIPSEAPGESPGFRMAGINELSYPHSVMVNRAGRRFADESRFQHAVPHLLHFDSATHSYPNMPCFLIFDANFLERYSIAGRAPGDPAPNWLTRSETIGGLAAELGIDGETLAQTIERYNRYAADGRDPDFDRGSAEWSFGTAGDLEHRINPNLAPVSEPPFFGVRLVPSGLSSAGLLTNDHGGVIDVSGQPIDGLYACGNAAAQTDYGAGYQAGLSLMSGMTFGYLAVHHASREHNRG